MLHIIVWFDFPVNRIERLSEREKYAMELYSQSYKPTQIARMMGCFGRDGENLS